jgi:hypothetical protein
LEEIAVGARCPGGARLHPGFEDYFFFDFLAFFAFFAFFAFLAMVSSQGLMDGNATPRHARRRASLATSSTLIQQIRGALPRAVTSLSLRYPQLICIFDAILRILARRTAPHAVFRARSSAGREFSDDVIKPPVLHFVRVNDAPMRGRGFAFIGNVRTARPRHLHQIKTTAGIARVSVRVR